ncbi:MAG: hypothetical protein M4579_004907 [Chaenotheca gracillima]|nr:MAG: hypothetical protein M4579_004907 [Chaenotheca gracillima]
MFEEKETTAHNELSNSPDVGALTPELNEHDVDWSHVDEAKILRKMDLRLIPVLALLYLLAFLDRGNIGNAKIEGLTETLNMTGPQYNWTLTVFFFTYAAFEVPSNLLLKRFKPSIWLPSIMVAWGVVMTLMGIVQDYKGLLIARLFLGVAEAGLYPGIAYYITLWYVRKEAQFRQALFFSAASVAGAFSGLLAFAIAKMDMVGGLEGWRWIFILEGMATVLCAILGYFTVFDFPDTASFLTPEERAWIVYRLKYEGSSGSGKKVAEDAHFQWKYVKDAFTDWQIYLGLISLLAPSPSDREFMLTGLVVYWGIVCPLYGISLFLPTIINQLGYEASTAQLLTVPIYTTAAVASVTQAYFSDKLGKRIPFIFFNMCLIATGFIMTLAASSVGGVPGVVYAGVFITTIGIYSAFPGNVTLLANNLAGSYKRSAGMAIHIGVGNLGGAFASNFYRSADMPKYVLGHALELGFVCAGLMAVVALRVSYAKVNAARDRKGLGEYTDKELSELGDKSPTFRYVL